MKGKKTISWLIPFCCVSMEQKEHALLLKKMSDWNVPCVDLRNRAPIKGVISGVVLEVNAKDAHEELDQVVGAQRLTRMVECGSPVHPFYSFLMNTLSLLTCIWVI